MTILGAVLAGGRSLRFGSDKAAAMWRGRPLIEHVIAAVMPHVDTVIVCGRDWPGRIDIDDHPEADLGPLGGLNAALKYAATCGYSRILSAPCDAPLLPAELLHRLAASEVPAVVADLPVLGVWPVALAGALDDHLKRGEDRSLRAWAAITKAEQLCAGPLHNVNRPVDLDALDA